jgi:hypothetical protein
VVNKELSNSVQELRVTCNSTRMSQASQNLGGKERVSFGTNMSTEEENLDGRSMEQKPPELMTVIKQFHMRKFKDHRGVKS